MTANFVDRVDQCSIRGAQPGNGQSFRFRREESTVQRAPHFWQTGVVLYGGVGKRRAGIHYGHIVSCHYLAVGANPGGEDKDIEDDPGKGKESEGKIPRTDAPSK